MKSVAIAKLFAEAADHPGLTGAIVGLTFLAIGVWWLVWNLVNRVAELEGRHSGLAEDVADLDSEYFDQRTAQWAAIRNTRKKVAQVSRRVKRLRDEKGRFIKAHKAA